MPVDPSQRSESTIERAVASLVGRPVFWVAFMAAVISIPIAKAVTAKLPDAPPKLRQIPNFRLVDQDGHPYGTDELRGKLWVANFIFTSCGDVCPKLTKAMQEVQYRARNMRGVVHFVSISVDPKRDTPEVLLAYSEANKARRDWSFLTGPIGDVRALVVDGFGLGFAARDRASAAVEGGDPNDPAAQLLEAAHGQQLVLVDKDRWVRGAYDRDKDGIDRLMLDMGLIANLEGYSTKSLDPAPPAAASAPAGQR